MFTNRSERVSRGLWNAVRRNAAGGKRCKNTEYTWRQAQGYSDSASDFCSPGAGGGKGTSLEDICQEFHCIHSFPAIHHGLCNFMGLFVSYFLFSFFYSPFKKQNKK